MQRMGIIDGKPTVAYQLWHNVYAVKIQNTFLHTPIERMFRGAYTGDEEQDSLTRQDSTAVYRTPVAMALLFDMGKVPYIVKRKDVLTIYTLIVQHLNNVARAIQNPVSGFAPPPPMDLLIFEKFAAHIYEDAMFEQGSVDAQNRRDNYDGSLEQFFRIFGGSDEVSRLQSIARSERGPEELSNLARAWDVVEN